MPLRLWSAPTLTNTDDKHFGRSLLSSKINDLHIGWWRGLSLTEGVTAHIANLQKFYCNVSIMEMLAKEIRLKKKD